jgi:hypothetical protein
MGLSENRGFARFTGYAWLLIIPAGCKALVAAGRFSFDTALVASARDCFFFILMLLELQKWHNERDRVLQHTLILPGLQIL